MDPRYRLDEIIGQGSIGTIYRAWDTNLNREVALKMLKEGPSVREDVRKRFLREARATASLDHPHIVKVLDAGEDDAGRAYLVMEMVAGEPLETILDQGRFELRWTVGILEQAARGIQHAHDNGIVHRDLKPGNILVATTGEAKVLDFGLAHLENSESMLTKAGAVLGTPFYMAPEQARGEADAISPATDVYALGAILYEVLTGKPPFHAERVMTVFKKILNEKPVPPRKLNRAAPRALEKLCLEALEKDPARRPVSAGAFADAIHAWLDSPEEPAAAGGSARRWLGAAVLLVLVGGLVAGGLAFWPNGGASPSPTPAPAGSTPPVPPPDPTVQHLAAYTALSETTESAMRDLEDHRLGAAWSEAHEKRLVEVMNAADTLAQRVPASRLPRAWKGLALVQARREAQGLAEMDAASGEMSGDPWPCLIAARARLCLYGDALPLPESAAWGSLPEFKETPAQKSLLQMAKGALDEAAARVGASSPPRLAELRAWHDAATAVSEGRPEEAPAKLDLVKSPAGAADVAILRGFALLRAVRFAAAAEAWESGAAKGTVRARILAGLARLHAAAKEDRAANLGLAVADLAAASERRPDIAELAGWRAEAHGMGAVDEAARGGDPSPFLLRAATDLDAAVRAAPNAARWWLARARLLSALAGHESARSRDPVPNLDRAASDFTEAAKREPAAWEPVLERAEVLFRKAQAEEARGRNPVGTVLSCVADATDVLQRRPGDPAALELRSRAYRLKGLSERLRGADPSVSLGRAIADATEAVRRDPRRLPTYLALARAWSDRGDWEAQMPGGDPVRSYDEAGAAFGEYLRLTKPDADVLLERGLAMRARGDALAAMNRKAQASWERALADFEQAAALKRDWKIQVARGMTLDRLGRTPEAIAVYEQALKENPGNAVVSELLQAARGKKDR